MNFFDALNARLNLNFPMGIVQTGRAHGEWRKKEERKKTERDSSHNQKTVLSITCIEVSIQID